MAKKINLSGVKEFMFNHGEKVALGSCVLVALLLGSLGIIRAMSANLAVGSSESWVDAFKKSTNKINTDLNSVAEVPIEKQTIEKMDPKFYDWKEIPSNFVQSSYLQGAELRDDKRQNPLALPIRVEKDKKTIFLEYIRGLVLVHEYSAENRTVWGLREAGEAPPVPQPKGSNVAANIPPFVQAGKATRMIVGTMIFPMKQQVEEFRKALRLPSQKELFDNPDDLPRPKGFNLIRFEILPNGQPANKKGELVIGVDPETGKFKVAPGLDKLLREAVYDEKLAELIEPFVWEGFTMPMPKLANARYGKFDLEGIEVAWEEEGGDMKKEGPGVEMKKQGSGFVLPKGGFRPRPPMPVQGEDPRMANVERKPEAIKEKDLRGTYPSLVMRLFGKQFDTDLNPFHILGQNPLPKDETGVLKQVPGPGVMTEGTRDSDAWKFKEMPGGGEQPRPNVLPPKKGGEQPMPQVAFANWDRDALVRFIDVDVEPGKTYQYAIQIRIANPNYAKKDQVAFQRLAQIQELESPWTLTHTITVPKEYYLYALDQQLLDDIAADKKLQPENPKLRDMTTFQIHQWITKQEIPSIRDEFPIGDFAVAERILVRKGDPIGQQAMVRVPVWFKYKDTFLVPSKDTKAKGGAKLGFPMDLLPPAQEFGGGKGHESPFPILVDFAGGKRKLASTEEDSAVEALVLSPDGKLRVLNSRVDSDTHNAWGRERHDRVSSVRKRVDDIQNGTQQKNGPNAPPGRPAGGGS